MSFRDRLFEALTHEGDDTLEELIKNDPRTVRLLLGACYQADETVRRAASRGMGFAARHHPVMVQNAIRRLVWAMNDESGTNAVNAPEALLSIAFERPEMLLPSVPDLLRLASDPGLNKGLTAVLRTVSKRCPGEVGRGIAESLNRRFIKGTGSENGTGS